MTDNTNTPHGELDPQATAAPPPTRPKLGRNGKDVEAFCDLADGMFDDDGIAALIRSLQSRAAKKAGNATDRAIEPKHISEVLTEWLRSVDAGPPDFLATPFPALNRYLGGGFAPGELVYLGARTGKGKTSVALEISRHAASRRRNVLIISREMLNEALLRRIISQDARIPALALKTGRLSEAEWRAFAGRHDRLKSLPLWMTDKAISLEEIVALADRFAASRPIGLLVVDYLQLVRAPREAKDRRLQVEEVSGGLKSLAVRHRIPVLCISSLSRPFGGDKKDEPPTLESLRESGELEYDADIVLFIHRKRRENATDLILAKARDGREGVVHLVFTPEYVSFDPAPDDSEKAQETTRLPRS
jgi:replicative DNA helicase